MASDPPRIKPTLHGVPETLLLTVWTRTLDAKSPRPILADPHAESFANLIEYDYSALKLNEPIRLILIVRTALLDAFAQSFIERHRRCSIVHIACGLDTRLWRVFEQLKAQPDDDGDIDVRWFDIDLPDVVQLRSQLMSMTSLPELPTNVSYSLTAADVLATGPDDFLHAIPADRPTMIITEGLLVYLEPTKVPELLARIVRRFSPVGGEVATDITSRVVIRFQKFVSFIRPSGAKFLFAADRGSELEGIGADNAVAAAAAADTKKAGGGLRLVESIIVAKDGKYPQNIKYDWKTWIMTRVPGFWDSNKVARYQF